MDRTTLSKIDSQSQSDFAGLLQTHRGIVVKVASAYAQSFADRDDLMQEIALQLWRSYSRFNPAQAKFSTWMYRVALNVAISHARQHREQARIETLEDWHLHAFASDGDANESDVQLAELYRLIHGLDALHRALILLYLDDRSSREIADVLGISESNVNTKINRIKQRLRQQVSDTPTSGA